MSDFDPGPGWRMEQFDRSEVPVGAVAYHEADGSWTYWVREVQVPALPTAPYTVIRVTWKSGSGIGTPCFFLHSDGDWFHIGPSSPKTAEEMTDLVASFEVLSEPRAVTAKAVLQALAATANEIREVDAVEVTGERWRAIAREFGVEG